MNNYYKTGFYIRDFKKSIDDGRYFKEEDNTKRFELYGVMRACRILLREYGNTGFAYDGGTRLSDKMTARRLFIDIKLWETYKKRLLRVGLLKLDDNEAWGIGTEEWDLEQGAIKKYNEYQHNYYKTHKKQHIETIIQPVKMKPPIE